MSIRPTFMFDNYSLWEKLKNRRIAGAFEDFMNEVDIMKRRIILLEEELDRLKK